MGGIASALVGIGGGLIGSLIQGHQISRAVKAQVDAANQAIGRVDQNTQQAVDRVETGLGQTQEGIRTAVDSGNQTLADSYAKQGDLYGQQKGNLDPYLAAGNQGITSLSSLLQPGGELTKQFSFDAADLRNDPGYQFQLQQGSKALQSAAAAKGAGMGGGAQKSLARYSQGLADTTYTNAFNRNLTAFQTNRNNLLQPLSTLINAGQTASGQFNNAAQNYGADAGLYGNSVANNLYRGAAYSGDAGMSAAREVGDYRMQDAREVAPILEDIGTVKAGGSIAQGNNWGSFASGTASTLSKLGGLSGRSTGGAPIGTDWNAVSNMAYGT